MNAKEKFLKIYNYKYMNIILFAIEFIFSCCCFVSLMKIAIGKDLLYRLLFLVSAFLLFISVILLFFKYRKRIEYLFLVIVIPLGLGYLFLLLPNQVPDEYSHISKAYLTAEGKFFIDSNKIGVPIMKIPKSFAEYSHKNKNSYYKLDKAIGKPANYNNKIQTQGDSAASYTFLDYIISSVGFNIARLFNLSMFIGFYLARFFNLLLFIITGFLVLKYIPLGKLFMFVYLLTPMMLQQCSSISSDVVLNCSSLLFITYILYLKYNDKIKVLNLKNILLLGILMIIISSSKIVYFPLVFLVFLLNKKMKNIDKKYKSLLFIFIALSLACSVFFYFESVKYNVHLVYRRTANPNAGKQLKYVMTNPIGYLKVLVNTLWIQQEFYVTSLLGQDLGSTFQIQGPFLPMVVLVILFLISPFLENNKYEFKKSEKYIINFLVIILFNLVLGTLYLSWTSVSKNIIDGVQGRYFIPFIFLTFLTFINVKKYIKFKNVNLIYFTLLFMINICSLYTVWSFFR